MSDEEYVKFCLNFRHYIDVEPVFGIPRENSLWTAQNGGGWYKHVEITVPYPVMFLEDIEIHWIHEKNEASLLEKYNRRKARFHAEKPYPLFLFSCADSTNDLDPVLHSKLVSEFLSLDNAFYCTRYTSDIENNPRAFKSGNLSLVNEWVNASNERNASHIPEIHTVIDRIEEYKKLIRRKNVYCS
jgi:hypothetical protein